METELAVLEQSSRVHEYLHDSFLEKLYHDIARAGPLKSVMVDLTHSCNLRCKGCFFFAENMDNAKAPAHETDFDAFVERERRRGTNFMTVVGGEPSLMLDRLQKLYQNFWLVAVTNGLKPIPHTEFEELPIAISVWGDHSTDTFLRGNGKLDVFERALKHYRNDERACWYYTTTPGNAHEIPNVVEQCVQNGNYISFNFYGDVTGLGGEYDHRAGFARVRDAIDAAIDRYPERVLMSSYVAGVVSTGRLFDERWGYDVCGSISSDHPINAKRIKNGKLYSPHFRAYNPDLTSTRRCCVGHERDCSTCTDVWAHTSWIVLNAARHLESRQTFTNWLTATYLFYLQVRAVNFEQGIQHLPEIHRRTRDQRR